MKTIILTAVLMAFTPVAFAKGGGSDPAKLAFKNSQAGFVAESLEDSLRRFVNLDGGNKDQVKDAMITSTTTDNSTVNITMYDGSTVSYLCSRIDDFSNGGTVLKKEVICQLQ